MKLAKDRKNSIFSQGQLSLEVETSANFAWRGLGEAAEITDGIVKADIVFR
jgi:hypothetical protein